ncbi:MAG: nucleotidyltransferase family protein [Promethearchaeota archaeon]
MNSKEKVLSILKKNLSYLKNEFRITTIGIFGSYSKNETSEESDIDILVVFSKSPGIVQFMKMREYLSSILGKKVDLVTKQALKPDLKTNILMETVYV